MRHITFYRTLVFSGIVVRRGWGGGTARFQLQYSSPK